MQLFGVREIGSNVLKNTSETSIWRVSLEESKPVQQNRRRVSLFSKIRRRVSLFSKIALVVTIPRWIVPSIAWRSRRVRSRACG
jgi:hypothetical protein